NRVVQSPSPPPAQSPDRLGRDTPRGTVLGFLNAARRGNDAVAARYLNTSLPREAAEERARQLFTILDTSLPARMTQVSDDPQGSQSHVLEAGQELVGTIATDHGDVDIVLERATRANGAVWLFSNQTLDDVPELYEEVSH